MLNLNLSLGLSLNVDMRLQIGISGCRSGIISFSKLLFFRKPIIVVKRLRPYISKDLCDRCRECVETCPYDVFSDENGHIEVTNAGDCIECTSCVEMCPKRAIYMDD